MPDLSFDEIRGLVSKAIGQTAWVRECYPDCVIYQENYDTGAKLYKVEYAILEGKVTLGEKKEVRQAYESINESIIMESAEFDSENRIIKNAVLIQAGESNNRNDYPADVLKRDGPAVFEEAKGYFGHVQSYHERTDPRNLALTVRNVRFGEADSKLRGDIHYFEDAGPTIAKVKEAFDSGQKDVMGLSIQVNGRGKVTRKGNKAVRVVEALTRDATTSVDIVVGPAAGGRLFEATMPEEASDLKTIAEMSLEELKTARPDLYEAALKEAGNVAGNDKEPAKVETPIVDEVKITEALESKMDARLKEIEDKANCRVVLSESLRAANLPAELESKVRSAFDGKMFEAEELNKEIDSFKIIAAKMSPIRLTEGQSITIGADAGDKMQAALDLAFGVTPEDAALAKTRPFRGLREAYTLFTGDTDVVGQFRISEAGINSGTFAYALGTSMYRKLTQAYRERDWGERKICSIRSAPNFKTQEEIRLPYYSDLDDVNPETADYVDIQQFSDEKAYYGIKQKGNTLPVTRKTIINDDIGALGRTVGNLGRAARRTVAKKVFKTMLEDNATYTVEGNAFFMSGTRTPTANYNLRASASNALSETNVNYAKRMLKQMVEPGSGELIGMDARPGDMVLIVPTALEDTAVSINQANLSTAFNSLKGFFGANNEDIVVCPLLTNTTDYYLAWKESIMEWLILSFLNGQQEPEFFLADNPLVGDMFFADKMTYKIRHEYEAAFIDCRGCYKTDSTA